MSKEFIEAEMALFKKQAAECDIIITTALIPGQPAPKLILKEAVDVMKPGSVIIDLASQNGGNCEYTIPGEINVVNGVKVVGYTDFPSRMANQSSSLYANNISKLVLSMVTKDKKYLINMEDEVVRGSIVTYKNQMLWPNPNPPMLDAAKKPKAKAVKEVVIPEDKWVTTMRTAGTMSIGLGSIVGLGVMCPTPQFLAMTTTFALAVVAGYQCVWGVSPALHTPLMSVTNAISGITAIGGLCLLGGGYLPHTIPQTLAAASVLVSTVNIFGGFVVTKRMLDMFKRKGDPEEYNQLYALPAATTMGLLSLAMMNGVPNMEMAGYLAASLCCIGGISGLATQPTARIGNALGMIGVSTGVVTAFLHLNFPLPVLMQALVMMGASAAVGSYIGAKVQITELPQTVAAFHS